MENLKIEITPDEFNKITTPDGKLDVMYKAMVVHQTLGEKTQEKNETRFVKLEKRKLKDTGLSAAFGGAMGFLAGLLKY